MFFATPNRKARGSSICRSFSACSARTMVSCVMSSTSCRLWAKRRTNRRKIACVSANACRMAERPTLIRSRSPGYHHGKECLYRWKYPEPDKTSSRPLRKFAGPLHTQRDRRGVLARLEDLVGLGHIILRLRLEDVGDELLRIAVDQREPAALHLDR